MPRKGCYCCFQLPDVAGSQCPYIVLECPPQKCSCMQYASDSSILWPNPGCVPFSSGFFSGPKRPGGACSVTETIAFFVACQLYTSTLAFFLLSVGYFVCIFHMHNCLVSQTKFKPSSDFDISTRNSFTSLLGICKSQYYFVGSVLLCCTRSTTFLFCKMLALCRHISNWIVCYLFVNFVLCT